MLNLKDLCQVEAALRKETGLKLNQSFALCCLRKGPLNAGALADELRIHGASLSRVIKALILKGYIVGDQSLEDSRLKVLSLTSKGEQVADALALCENRLFPVAVVERGLAEIG